MDFGVGGAEEVTFAGSRLVVAAVRQALRILTGSFRASSLELPGFGA